MHLGPAGPETPPTHLPALPRPQPLTDGARLSSPPPRRVRARLEPESDRVATHKPPQFGPHAKADPSAYLRPLPPPGCDSRNSNHLLSLRRARRNPS
jgi:hypothetical protein